MGDENKRRVILGARQATIEAKRSAIRDYQDLEVWKRSIRLAKAIYGMTGTLPSHEQFGLVAQIRRAVVSVPSNIAEGYGRQATGDYRHHLSIARGSLLELDTQIVLCVELGYLGAEDVGVMHADIRTLAKMLSALIAKLR